MTRPKINARADFAAWRRQVELLCQRRVATSWNDLCGDEEPLREAFTSGETAESFVQRLIEKYDLTEI